MIANTVRWVGAPLLAAVALAFTSCSTMDGVEEVDVIETPDGAIVVDTFASTYTVTAIDPVKRRVTLASASGHKTTYKAGPEVVNFAQLRVGDRVNATVTEEVAVYIGRGAPPSAMFDAGVALAPAGAKPGGMLVETAQVNARVTNVDTTKHKVTFELPDGSTKQVKVGKKVDLSTVRPGDNVTVQVGEGLALAVEKP